MKDAIELSGIQWRYMSDGGNAWVSEQGGAPLHGDEVKSTDKRRVVRLPGVYLKEVYYRGVRRWLKTLFGGTACKEGRKSLLLAQKGISTPQVLAFGQEVSGGLIRRDVLITREIGASKTLYDVIFDEYRGYSFQAKLDLIRSFAEFIHRIHGAGIFHHDLHIGNILIRKDGEECRFFLLDTDRVRFSGSLSPEEKAENLSLLLINFQKLTTRTERFRFLKYYDNLEGKGRIDRRFLVFIEKKALTKSIKSWHKRALRSVGNNNRFISVKKNRFLVFSQRSSHARIALNAILPDPDIILEKGEVLKAGRTVKAATVFIDGRKYFLKRYNDKGFVYSLRNAFRKSRAVGTWLVSWEFLVRGLPVPEPILCLEERSFRFLKRSYILYEYVENSLRLPQKWPLLDVQTRKSILIRLAIKLGWMHRTGGIHGDLKWNNILTDEKNDIYIIDFDGSRVSSRYGKYKITKDLGRFLKDLSRFEEDEGLRLVFENISKKWR